MVIQFNHSGNLGFQAALAAVVAFPVVIFLHRGGYVDFQAAIAIMSFALLTCILLFICGLVAYFRRKSTDAKQRHLKTTLTAGIPVVFALIVVLSTLDGTQPIIHDITTDLQDVPQFEMAVELRGSDSNSLAVIPEALALQQAAYKDIRSVHTELAMQEAFALAQKVAADMNWDIYHIVPQRGLIEASDKTPIWGFVDDIVIRVTQADSGSTVDLRSVSRVGQGDLGANAARIRDFQQRFASAEQSAH